MAERLTNAGNSYQVDQYDAYGNRSERLLDYSDPFGFGGQAGYYTDLETGLMLCTNRYYDSVLGRFLTRDPLGYAGGVNLYSYTANNPVNEIDPDGTNALSDWYWGGMGGISDWVSAHLLNGSDKNLGHVVGEHDSGCASGADVVWAGVQFGGNLALNAVPGGGEARGAEVATEVAVHAADDAGEAITKNVLKKVFSADQRTVIELAKDAQKRGGVSSKEANTLMDWAREYGLDAHGPEIHSDTRPSSWAGQNLHFHVGTINHIPIK